MRIQITDRAPIPVSLSHRKILDNGYMQVPGRVARVGIQQYLASELGLDDRPAGALVNVYRPPETVFDAESLASYDNADITVEHPSEMVDATTYDSVSVGHAVSPGRQEGEFVVVDMLIKAKEAIDAIEGGKAELSAGYLAEYVPQAGTAPDGSPYEFIQRGIAVNHIALCDSARAGRLARLFDSRKEPAMTYHVTLDSGQKVEVGDEAAQIRIQSTIDSLTAKVAQFKDEAEAAETKAESAQAQVDQLEDKVEDLEEKLDEIEATEAMDSARKIAGKEFTCDSKKSVDIKRAALDSAGIKCKRAESWAKASDAYVAAYFDAEADKREAEDEDEDDERKHSNDSLRNLGRDIGKAKPTQDAQSQRNAAHQEFLDRRYNKGAK